MDYDISPERQATERRAMTGTAVGTGTYTIAVHERTGYLLKHGHLCCWATPGVSGDCTCGLMETMNVVADRRTPELEAERAAQFFGRLRRVAAALNEQVKSGDAKDPGPRDALLHVRAAERLAKEQGFVS